MKKNLIRSNKTLLAFLCIFILITFLFLVLLPHHHCSDPNCQICMLISSYKDLIMSVAIYVFGINLIKDIYSVIIHLCHIKTQCNETPIYLKVKLSN